MLRDDSHNKSSHKLTLLVLCTEDAWQQDCTESLRSHSSGCNMVWYGVIYVKYYQIHFFVSTYWKSQQSTRPSPLLFAAATWSHFYGKSNALKIVEVLRIQSSLHRRSCIGIEWHRYRLLDHAWSNSLSTWFNMPLKARHVLPWILQVRARSTASQMVTLRALIEYNTLSKCASAL